MVERRSSGAPPRTALQITLMVAAWDSFGVIQVVLILIALIISTRMEERNNPRPLG